MKPEDIEFVRSQKSHNRSDIQRLLSLLIEAEAMREKAEFELQVVVVGKMLVETDSSEPISALHGDPRHDWSDADWIANVKKEWGI